MISFGSGTYISWFKNMSLGCIEEDFIEFKFPSKFIFDHCKQHYESDLLSVSQKELPKIIKIKMN